MNKNTVDKGLPLALDALKICGIANSKGEIKKTYRGQISSFGAAVTMGSFKAAVAFFADNGSSSTERSNLIEAMYYVVSGGQKKDAKKICEDIIREKDDAAIMKLTEDYINASISLKLAMNAFELTK